MIQTLQTGIEILVKRIHTLENDNHNLINRIPQMEHGDEHLTEKKCFPYLRVMASLQIGHCFWKAICMPYK